MDWSSKGTATDSDKSAQRVAKEVARLNVQVSCNQNFS
jgi:hypothetical protein